MQDNHKYKVYMSRIVSPKNYLNLDRMVIYFLSSPDKKDLNKMVLGLNTYQAFTADLYSYEIRFIDSTSEEYKILPEDIRSALDGHNFVNRLADDFEGNIVYDFDDVNITCNPMPFYKEMWVFVQMVRCWEYEHLDDLLVQAHRHKNTEIRKRKKELRDMRFAVESVIRNTTIGDCARDIRAIMRGDGEKSHTDTNSKPNFCISIEKVPYIDKRKNRENSRYGISVKIGDYSIPICFESTDQTMLYIAAILRYKMNMPLYIHELRNNQLGNAQVRENSRRWLNKLFSVIVSKEQRLFDKWINDTIRDAEKKGQAIYQAKSATARVIKQKLQLCPNAIAYCLLNTEKGKDKDSYYNFRCEPDDISVCAELQDIMQEFDAYTID